MLNWKLFILAKRESDRPFLASIISITEIQFKTSNYKLQILIFYDERSFRKKKK